MHCAVARRKIDSYGYSFVVGQVSGRASVKRIREEIEAVLIDVQCGFRGRGRVDLVIVVKQAGNKNVS